MKGGNDGRMKTGRRCAALIVIASLLFGLIVNPAFGASTRYALVTEITGTATVIKSGGTKEFRAYKGMTLNEGDRIKVGDKSSVKLKIADSEDEIVLGANWNGALSLLRTDDNQKTTAVKNWSGSMLNLVSPNEGTYRVETPTTVMGVRGTVFAVTVDPETGLVRLLVNSGIVNAASHEEAGGVNVLPAQQTIFYAGYPSDTGVSYVDISSFADQADVAVLAELLLNKARIDEENEQLLENLQAEGPVEDSTLPNLASAEVLEAYRQNVLNVLHNILITVVEQGVLAPETVEEIITIVNAQIQEPAKQFDLNRDIPEIDPTVGVDPQAEQARRQSREEAERQHQTQQRETKSKRDEIRQNNSDTLEEIRQDKERQDQQNREAQEQKDREAAERYRDQLAPDEREAFDQRYQAREQERLEQESGNGPAQDANPGAPAGGGATEPPGGEQPGGEQPGEEEPGEQPGEEVPGEEEPGEQPGGEDPVDPPTVTIRRVPTAEGHFDIVLEFANFTGQNAVYGFQLHLIFDWEISGEWPDFEDYFNEELFGDGHTADQISRHFMYDEENEKEIIQWIYSFVRFGEEGHPVEIGQPTQIARIPFMVFSEEMPPMYVYYWQFVNAEGNVIENVQIMTDGVDVMTP
jgi:hypothetical protein